MLYYVVKESESGSTEIYNKEGIKTMNISCPVAYWACLDLFQFKKDFYRIKQGNEPMQVTFQLGEILMNFQCWRLVDVIGLQVESWEKSMDPLRKS